MGLKKQTNLEIHAWLSRILEEKQTNPSRLAAEAGLSGTTLSRFMKDPETANTPSTTTIQKIVDATGIPYAPEDPSSGVNMVYYRVSAAFLDTVMSERYSLNGGEIVEILETLREYSKRPEYSSNPDSLLHLATGMVLAKTKM